MSCCPSDSWPAMRDDYKPTGKIVDVPGTQLYVVGTAASKKSVLLHPDIFGPDSGRIKALADQLADQLGVLAIVINYFQVHGVLTLAALGGGPEFKEWALKMDTETVIKPQCKAAIEYAKSQGAEKFGMIGFCYGVWISFHVGADSAFHNSGITCAIGYHPVAVEEMFFARSTMDLAKKNTAFPYLLCSAENDPASMKADGEITKAFKEHTGPAVGTVSIDFPDMKHGWVNRGDLKDEKVNRDVKIAVEEGINFLKLHLIDK